MNVFCVLFNVFYVLRSRASSFSSSFRFVVDARALIFCFVVCVDVECDVEIVFYGDDWG